MSLHILLATKHLDPKQAIMPFLQAIATSKLVKLGNKLQSYLVMIPLIKVSLLIKTIQSAD